MSSRAFVMAAKALGHLSIVSGIISVIAGYSTQANDGVTTYVLFLTMMLMITEGQLIHTLLRLHFCHRLRQKWLRKLYMTNYIMRGGLYGILSIPCYIDSTPSVFVGVVLTILGVFLMIAGSMGQSETPAEQEEDLIAKQSDGSSAAHDIRAAFEEQDDSSGLPASADGSTGAPFASSQTFYGGDKGTTEGRDAGAANTTNKDDDGGGHVVVDVNLDDSKY